MKQLIYVPLERLDNRYTVHLDKDIVDYLKENKIPYTRIGAPYTDAPPEGHFLNSVATIKNKMFQLETIATEYKAGRVSDKTVFFFSDIWFPGIEAIKYLNHFHRVKPKITGIIHAGSFTQDDHLSDAGNWAAMFEDWVFQNVDEIYCASQFIKSDILKKRWAIRDKLTVTGLPLDSSLFRYLTDKPKDNIVVFTGRLAKDKRPWLFEDLRQRLSASNIRFFATQDMSLSKPDYYRLLASAKVVVSYATQENFGYGVQEAVYLGCIPVVPNALAYKEQFGDMYRFDNFEESVEMVKTFVSNYDVLPKPEPTVFHPFKTWFNL